MESIKVKFWGVRGTLPVPGKDSLIYGGNTSCVAVSISKKPLMIFDAGSGIKKLGDTLLKERFKARIFLSHGHWDHINAFPFFVPLYQSGNKIEVYGPKNPNCSVKKIISDQMSDIYFPITIQHFSADVSYHDLVEQEIELDGVVVKTMLLSHPGNCLGYRVQYKGFSICYVTDNELFLPEAAAYSADYYQRLVQFVKKADVLITDTTYSDEEYKKKVSWGHSSVRQVAQLGVDAQVKKLCLFHHDPNQNDADIAKKSEAAQEFIEKNKSSCVCLCPKELDEIELIFNK